MRAYKLPSSLAKDALKVFHPSRSIRIRYSSRFSTYAAAMAAQKKASIVIVGLPWDDERIPRLGADPLKVKEGIEMIGRLMEENGFGEGYVSVQASDKTGLDDFKNIIRTRRRDALFLGGGLRIGGGFESFREEVIAAAKEIQPDINVVQVSLNNGPQSVIDAAEEVEKSL